MSSENLSVETVSVEAGRDEAVFQEVRPRVSFGAVGRFLRHLVEMVVAMLAGMAVLIGAILSFGTPPGYSNLFVEYALMGVAMVVPMVAWMRYKGHSWRDGWEMGAAMVVPMYALVAPVALGISVPGLTQDSLMLLAHVAMIGGMITLMIFRWGRYTCKDH